MPQLEIAPPVSNFQPENEPSEEAIVINQLLLLEALANSDSYTVSKKVIETVDARLKQLAEKHPISSYLITVSGTLYLNIIGNNGAPRTQLLQTTHSIEGTKADYHRFDYGSGPNSRLKVGISMSLPELYADGLQSELGTEETISNLFVTPSSANIYLTELPKKASLVDLYESRTDGVNQNLYDCFNDLVFYTQHPQAQRTTLEACLQPLQSILEEQQRPKPTDKNAQIEVTTDIVLIDNQLVQLRQGSNPVTISGNIVNISCPEIATINSTGKSLLVSDVQNVGACFDISGARLFGSEQITNIPWYTTDEQPVRYLPRDCSRILVPLVGENVAYDFID